MNTIYTRDEASLIVEKFEDILSQHNIHIPSPEDDERDVEDMIGLYGSVYSNLLDSVEAQIYSIISRRTAGEKVVTGEFSGTI